MWLPLEKIHRCMYCTICLYHKKLDHHSDVKSGINEMHMYIQEQNRGSSYSWCLFLLLDIHLKSTQPTQPILPTASYIISTTYKYLTNWSVSRMAITNPIDQCVFSCVTHTATNIPSLHTVFSFLCVPVYVSVCTFFFLNNSLVIFVQWQLSQK